MKALSILLPGGQEGSFSLDILLSPPSHTTMQGLAFFIRDLSDPPSFHSCKSLSPSRLKKPSADDAPTTLHTQTCFGRGRRGKEVPYPFHPLPRIKITPSTFPPPFSHCMQVEIRPKALFTNWSGWRKERKRPKSHISFQ